MNIKNSILSGGEDRNRDLIWIGILMVVAFLLRMLSNQKYGFHRDEFLYISQGQHLDWGFWSNPPGPAFFSWLTQATLGDSLWAIRFFPALLGVLTIGLVCLMARDMGGKRYAQLLAGICVIISSSMPRAFLMYNPVPFDIFYWTLLAFLLLRYIKRGQNQYLWYLGLTAGLGFINKYSILFFALPAIIALLTTKHRKVFQRRDFWIGVSLGMVIILPNIGWQWNNGFPVIGHMEELQQNQLTNVRPLDFIKDQLLFNASVLLVWLPGLWYLFASKKGTPYRLIGIIFIGIIALLLFLQGKSYYTLGAYPMMFAAGACMWEHWTTRRIWLRIVPLVVCPLIFFRLMPFSVPYLKLDKMIAFGQEAVEMGLDGVVRWEDGEIHPLPQDYADMLGWEELGDLVKEALSQLNESESYLIYCENFGQVGAVNYYGKNEGIKAVSFADAFAYWVPEELTPDVQTFIYVNDELGDDVANLFENINEVGRVNNPYARERGTRVYLCQHPRSSFPEFWALRVRQVRTNLGMLQE